MSGGWVRWENTTPENLKVAPASDRAFRLWFNACCYCSRNKTDGKVPAVIITALSRTATRKTVDELLELGLLERLDAKTYVVHDYLDFNPTRKRIEEMREGTRNRVAEHRERERNGVAEPSVTALQEHYSHGRDRSVSSSDSVDVPHQGETATRREPPKRVDQSEFPASLPVELEPVARQALSILEAVQVERGGDVPSARGVGLALARFPDRDHVAVARELEHWALAGRGQGRPVKDWARTLATFLERSPVGSAPRTNGTVVRFSRKESPGALLRAMNGEAS